jgi:predicted dehydrogenase
MKDISIGIVGCSSRIQGILAGVSALGKQIKIKALYDIDSQRTAAFREKYNKDAAICGSYEEMLAMKDIDWVVVSTYNALHASQSAKALRAGKNVFSEKPLATNLEDCKDLYDAYRKSGKKFMLGFTLRYAELYRKIKEHLDSGEMGKIISMEFNETLGFNHGGHIMCCWRRKEEFTGSHILEKCCHDIDMANWMLDSRAKYVSSFGGRNFFKPENSYLIDKLAPDDNGFKAYCQWPTARGKNPFTSDKDIIDNQVVIMEYANGTRATFHTNLNAGIPERRMYMLGEFGALRADFNISKIEVRKIGFKEEIRGIFNSQMISGSHGGADSILSDHFEDLMLHENVKPLSTVENGIESAITCFAIEEARKNRKIVDVDSYRF